MNAVWQSESCPSVVPLQMLYPFCTPRSSPTSVSTLKGYRSRMRNVSDLSPFRKGIENAHDIVIVEPLVGKRHELSIDAGDSKGERKAENGEVFFRVHHHSKQLAEPSKDTIVKAKRKKERVEAQVGKERERERKLINRSSRPVRMIYAGLIAKRPEQNPVPKHFIKAGFQLRKPSRVKALSLR